MAKKSWSVLDLSGGLQKSTSIMNHKNTELALAKNVDFSTSLGGIRKRYGYTQYGADITNTPEVLGLYDFEQNDGTHIYLSVANSSGTTLDQSQTNVGYGNLAIYGANWSAQTFTAGATSNFIGGKFYLTKWGSPGDLLVELRATTGGDPHASTIHSTQRINQSIITDGWNTIWMPQYSSYTSTTVYAMVFRQFGDAGDAANCYFTFGTTSDDYANGAYKKSVNSGGAWATTGIEDVGFKVYYLGDNSDIFRDISGTWTAESQGLTNQARCEFETFLNKVFVVNYEDATRSSTDGDTWSTAYGGLVLDAPSGRYIKHYGNRLWIANNSTDRFKLYYSSPIQGYDGSPITYINGTHSSATTTTVTVDSTQYLKDGLKFDVADPDGTERSTGASKEVLTVASPTTFTITSLDLSSTNWEDKDELYLENSRGTEYILWDSARAANNKAYGEDWVPVGPDDGQPITWLETAFDRLLVFKTGSVWTCDQDQNLSKIADRGTPAGRSVVNINEQVLFFNPDGFYKLGGEGVEKISHGIEKYVADIAPSGYAGICAGGTNNKYLAYVGDLPSFSLTNVVLEYDTDTGSWTLHTIADEINVWANIEVSDETELWFGTADGEIHRWAYGVTDDGTVVSLEAETGWYHLDSPNQVKQLSEIFIYSDYSPGVRCLIKSDQDKEWKDLGETGEDIVTRFTTQSTGRLFKLRFEYANNPIIEICGATFVWEETNAR